MKHLNFTAFIFALMALSSVAFAQDAKPADKQPQPKNEDRSFVSDYADKKASLVYLVEGKENPVTFKELSGKNVIFVDSTGADLTVAHGSDTFKFGLKYDTAQWRAARALAQKGDYENALLKMRDIVYPVIPLCALSESAFDASDFIGVYVEALLEAKHLKEAYAFAMALPIENSNERIINIAMNVASALVQKGEVAQAMKILEKVNLNEPAQFGASEAVLKVMAMLRGAGKVKELLPMYSKFGATENPFAPEFKLWSVYCDVALGNRMSAGVFLSSIKIDKTAEAFSLAQMIKGDLLASDPKSPNIGGALDAYAEGIVFGKVSSDWMPELLFKAGMLYKQLTKFVASNEIFAQISAMYPDSQYAKKGEKEVVKIEKKKETKDVSYEDDEDDEDDEDEE